MKLCPTRTHGHYSYATLRLEDYPPKCPKCMTAQDWEAWHKRMDAKQNTTKPNDPEDNPYEITRESSA